MFGMRRGWTLNRKATCHPERKHHAKGLCRECYRSSPEFKERKRDGQRKPEQREKQRLRKRRSNANGEHLRNHYGITLEDYYQILDAQDGVCAICGAETSGRERDKNGRLIVDHDHRTDKIRGLLCHKCNLGIGCFNDSPELLAAAMKYLQQ